MIGNGGQCIPAEAEIAEPSQRGVGEMNLADEPGRQGEEAGFFAGAGYDPREQIKRSLGRGWGPAHGEGAFCKRNVLGVAENLGSVAIAGVSRQLAIFDPRTGQARGGGGEYGHRRTDRAGIGRLGKVGAELGEYGLGSSDVPAVAHL